jgi:hypothetical protein
MHPTGVRFTVHRESSWMTVVGVVIALTVIETPLVHLALAGIPWLAWSTTALQISAIAWLVRDAIALAKGGVWVGDDVELAIGRRWRATIPRSAIARVERGEARHKREDFSIMGANVVLVLKEPIKIRWRKVDRVALSIDDADAFIASLVRI